MATPKGWKVKTIVVPVKVRVAYKPRTPSDERGTWQNAVHDAKTSIRRATRSTHFAYTGSYQARVTHVGRAKKVAK